jgi:hydrogenase maturation protein HypF
MSTVLATGAFLKNRAGLWQRGQFHASPLHGDLGTP